MRVKDSKNGISARAFAGTTGIMLAFDINEKLKKDFLGFAIRRTDKFKTAWLQGALRFPGEQNGTAFALADSNLAPIQKFRWSDYSVYPASDYSYEIIAVNGKPGKLKYTEGPTIKISTQSTKSGKYEVVFNRAVAASQAYERKFGNTKPNDEDDPAHLEAREWLSRGIKERVLSFMRRAKDSSFSLDIAIYEFEVREIVDVLNKIANKGKGPKIRLIYHAKKGDEQTLVNVERIHELDPSITVIPRVTHKIFHHKFVILKQNGQPLSVLAGSTNFTDNAFYLQANVVQIINDPAIAGAYEKLFDNIAANSSDPAKTKAYNSKPENFAPIGNTHVYFSPRKGLIDIAELKNLLKNAGVNFILCSAFDIHDDLVNIISDHPNPKVVKYGLQNSKSKLTGFHRNQTFTVPDFLRESVASAFKAESTKRRGGEGSIYIHLKTFVIDFATDHPKVIFGSHNFSKAASDGNDENLTIIENDTDLADIYMIEMFRLYDHYRFRFNQDREKEAIDDQIEELKKLKKTASDAEKARIDKQIEDLKKKKAAVKSKPLELTPDNSWIADYFDPNDFKFLERKTFMGD